MGHKSEAESMQELTSLMWNRYLKERVKEEQNHEMNAYKAEVVTNNGDGTLTVKRPFESVNLTLKAASSLRFAQPGDMVLVVGIGDKSKALSNAFILCKTDMTDDTGVPVYGFGDNLLVNSYFIGGGSQQGDKQLPINSSGLTTYTGRATFTINRWWMRNTSNAGSPTLNILSDGIQLITTGTNNQGLNQPVDGFRALAGKTVTASVLISQNTYTSDSYLVFGLWNSTTVATNNTTVQAISLAGQGTGLFTFTVALPQTWTNNFLNIGIYCGSSAGTIKIAAMKLEIGTKQTLAHLESGAWVLNEVPNYEEELLKCQTSTSDPGWDPHAHGVVSINTPKPNLLDNWYFAGGGDQQGSWLFPINQRKQTSYTSGYGIDRWRVTADNQITTTLQSDSVRLTKSVSGSNPKWLQIVNNNDLVGQTVTASILYKASYTNDGVIVFGIGRNLGTELPRSSGWNCVSITGPAASDSWGNVSNALYVGICLTQDTVANTDYIDIKAIKLELGTQQTLAHWDGSAWVLNDTPDYWEEFAECERYLKQISGGIFSLMSSWSDGTSLQIPFELWYGLRHKPTAIIKSGDFYAINPANVSQALLISVNAAGDGFTSSTAFATRTAIPVFSTSATNLLLFSAES